MERWQRSQFANYLLQMRQLHDVFVVARTSREVGVNLKEGYNGDLTSRQAGSVGGQMVKKMVEAYEQGLQ